MILRKGEESERKRVRGGITYTKDIDETFAVEALLNRELKGVDQFDEIASSKLPPFTDDEVQNSKKTIETSLAELH